MVLFNPLLRRKSTISKVNVIAQLEFELPYYDITLQHISHNASLNTLVPIKFVVINKSKICSRLRTSNYSTILFDSLWVFHSGFDWWFFTGVSDINIKFPHDSSILLSIVDDLNNAVFWVVLILPFIFSSSRLFPKLWELFQACQPQIESLSPSCATVFFSVLKQSSSICLSFRFLWFWICSPQEYQNPINDRSFFLLTITRSGLLARIKGFVRTSEKSRMLCTLYSRTYSDLRKYHFVIIKSLCLLGFRWLSIYPYRSSLPMGLLHYIRSLHRAAVAKFLLVDEHWGP